MNVCTRLKKLIVPAGVIFAVVSCAGCGDSGRGPYVASAEEQRDPVKAEECYREALADLQAHPDATQRGEKLLREALGYDLYHGAAHNNLGVILLQQDKLYDAAEEFEWARKLLPGHPEPRANLAIVLERGGKHSDALEAAKSALETAPGNLNAMQAIAYIQCRNGLTDGQTIGYLNDIVMRSNEKEWVDWAQRKRLSLEQPTSASRD